MMEDKIEAFKEDNPHLVVDDSLRKQFLEDELYERIFDLKDKLYTEEDRKEEIMSALLHTHLTLEEIDRIGRIIYE